MANLYAPATTKRPPSMGDLNESALITSVFMGTIAFVGIAGNGLLLRSYYKYKRLRTTFYTMFCSLSIADTIFLLVAVPAFIIDATNSPSNAGLDVSEADIATKHDTPARIRWCKFSSYTMEACDFTSAYLLVVLAVLRAILLTSRNRRYQPKPVHVEVLSCAILVIAFAASVPVLGNVISFGDVCYLDLDYAGKTMWMKVVFALFLPLGLMVVVHFVAHKLGKRYFSDSYSPREREKDRLVVAIIGTFAIFHLPYRLVSLYKASISTHHGTFQATEDSEQANMDTINVTNGTNNEYEFNAAGLENLEVAERYTMCLMALDKAIRPILYSKLASDLSKAFDEVINCTYRSRAYLDSSARDLPTRGQVDVQAQGGEDQINGHGTDEAQVLVAPGTETQTILVENAEVHNFDQSDEGYGESCSSSEGSASSGGNSAESKDNHDRNGRNHDRLMSTSSSASAASTTSHTPLVSRRDEAETLDDLV